jgi:hypothetical protein
MPIINLELSIDLEQKLQRRAAEQGLGVAQVALEILNNQLCDSTTTMNPNDLPFEVWRERFEAWIKGVPQINVGFVDDSRESIYEGR